MAGETATEFYFVGEKSGMDHVLKKHVKPPLLKVGESYKDWAKRFKCYVSLHDIDLALAMSLAAQSDVKKVIGQDHKEANRILYYTLSMVVSGKYLCEVQKVRDESGIEAWRLLERRFEEVGPTRSLGLLGQVLAPNLTEGEPMDTIDKWLHQVRNYEQASGEKLPDNVKIAVLLKAMNEPMRTQLQMKVTPNAKIDEVVKMIDDFHRLAKSWTKTRRRTPDFKHRIRNGRIWQRSHGCRKSWRQRHVRPRTRKRQGRQG